MNSILNFLKGQTWFDTIVNKLIRHAATYAGGAVMALALKHGIDNASATDLQNEIIGLVVTVSGIAYSMWDAKNVGNKLATASATGANSEQATIIKAQVDQAAADTAKVTEAVGKVQEAIKAADASAPQTMTDELARLANGEG